jgi:hypothetical protein
LPELVLLGAITYIAVLLAMKGVAGDDWSLIKEALHSRSRKKMETSHQEAKQQLSEIKN